jgi:uncharacterized protein YndB with AHSA1/START domain
MKDDSSELLAEESGSQADREPPLPFAKRYPVVAGVCLGLVLRFIFSGPAGSAWSAMSGAFIFWTPIAIGMVTVYLAERVRRRTWGYYFWAPMLATALFVAGTLVIMIEGLICAIVIIPMFSVLGAMGGLVMGITCRLTNWPKPAVYTLGALPLLLGALGAATPASNDFSHIERSIHIAAPPAVVWQALVHTPDIAPSEFEHGWAYRIGVPLPLSGEVVDTDGGKVRQFHMGKGVHFEGVVTDWQPQTFVRWTYRFKPDSFPAGALDDHVLIGGHYFDLLDTSYQLSPVADGTRLTFKVHYRVSTQFNLYASWVARMLLGNFGDVALAFYGGRSIAAVSTAPGRVTAGGAR